MSLLIGKAQNVATVNKQKTTKQGVPIPSGLDDIHLKEYKEKGYTRIELWRNSSERCVRAVSKCSCNGITRLCPICHGAGVDAYSITCINCVGKGWLICAWCQGVGYTDHIFVNSLDGTLLSADGKQVQNSSNSFNDSSTPSDYNRTKTCSRCYGSGFVPLSLGGIQTHEKWSYCKKEGGLFHNADNTPILRLVLNGESSHFVVESASR